MAKTELNISNQETPSKRDVQVITHITTIGSVNNTYKGLFPNTQEYDECRRIFEEGVEAPNPLNLDNYERTIPYTIDNGRYTDNKYSQGAKRCLLVAITGVGSRDKVPLAKIFHIQPGFFLNTADGNTFRIYYQDKLTFMGLYCMPDTLNIVISGSGRHKDDNVNDLYPESQHKNATDWLATQHYKFLRTGTIIVPPRNDPGLTDMYVNTSQQRIHVVHNLIK